MIRSIAYQAVRAISESIAHAARSGQRRRHQMCPRRRDDAVSPDVGDVGDAEYEVEAVLECKVVDGVLYYLVDWEGYGPESRTWEPADGLVNAMAKILEYQGRLRARLNAKQFNKT
ncbi:Chromo domain-containing protein [Plasmodiophora brassicae]|uniref:Chromo domain-containing protein n=1 Tax=Plasmodiophora brassicae TaxID=37360 RepID=A0A3P3YNZ8_PLABS|nr:unnamed protein product [Plasmodiophora brassicae]